MATITIKEYDACYAKLDVDRSIAHELGEYFSFYVPAYQFHPKVKAKIWDGKIRLFDFKTKLLYVGLLDMLKDFCEDFEYDLIDETAYSNKEDVPEDIAEQIAQAINLNPKYQVRDYQAKYIYEALRDNRSLNLSPTSCMDPKTLISVQLSEEDYEKLKKIRQETL